MKTQHNRRPSWVRDKSRPTIPESQPQLEHLRTLSQWLLIFPVVMLVLFSCGQIGIITSRKIAESSIQNNLTADYGPWSHVIIHSVRPAIIEDIFRDRQDIVGGNGEIPQKDESDTPWLNTIPLPTSVALLEPTSTFTPTPYEENQPSPTETGIPQITPTQTPQNSNTPTEAEPSITPSPIFTSIPTDIPTDTPPPTDLPTNTPVATISNIYWFSNGRVLTGYVLTPNQPTGSPVEESGYTRFFTDPFTAGTMIKGGKCTLTFYASNNTQRNMEIGIVVSAGTTRWRTLGGTTKTIPANTTTPTVFTNTFSILSHTFTQGERLSISISLSPFTTLHWDGEWNDSGLVFPPITP